MKKIIHKVKNYLSSLSLIDKFLYIISAILILSAIVNCISFYANAANEPSEDGGFVNITDLTGTVWEVPVGWAVTAGYGVFSVECNLWVDDELTGYAWSTVYFGYDVDIDTIEFVPASNTIVTSSFNPYSPTQTLRFEFLGGSDATNQRLIGWLINYGVLLEYPEPDPEPQAVTGWAVDETITFRATPIVETTPPTVDDYQTIYYYSDWVKPYAILRDVISTDGESFMPVVFYYDTYYEALYYGMDYIEREILAEPIFMDGFEKGKKEGYQNGLSMGESSAVGQNLLGDILSAPIRALDNLVIIDTPSGFSISVWNIFSALIGVALFIWFLKMFAGG